MLRIRTAWVMFEAAPVPQAVLGEMPPPGTVMADDDGYLLVPHDRVCGDGPCPDHLTLMVIWAANRQRMETRSLPPVLPADLRTALNFRLQTCQTVALTRAEAVSVLRHLGGEVFAPDPTRCRAMNNRGGPCGQKPIEGRDGYCIYHEAPEAVSPPEASLRLAG
jgi:hypothetical protein